MGALDLIGNEETEDGELDPDVEVTCKRCGKKNLQWYDSGVRWILIEQTSKLKPHVCTTRVNDDAFEDET